MRYIVLVGLLFFCVSPSQSLTVSGIRVINSYPINGAKNVHPLTGIGVTYSYALQKNSLQEDSILVYDNLGKKYSGTLKLSSNERTVIFTPSKPFSLGQTIHVRFGAFQTTENVTAPSYSLSFTIREKIAVPDSNFHSDDPLLELHLHKNFDYTRPIKTQSEPQNLPFLNTTTKNNPSNGNMYIANYKYVDDQTNTYRMILNKNGDVINAQGGGPDYFIDFKPNPDGTYSYYDAFPGSFIILDSNFSIINIISATYGYFTDSHEIRVTAEGDHIILAADDETIDMSQYIQGGWTTATVLVPIIEEFDRDNNLVFEWRAIDHFSVTDATHEDLLSDYIDFCHINSIEFDSDSNLAISSRHLDEITKINRKTGEIMWRWGGKNNQFKFEGDTLLFSHQHAVRRTDAGTFTMFDNGNFHPVNASYSRALEYQLDETKMIATKIWEFRHTPDILSPSMGYVQRLPNQNTFIGWGECNYLTVTEVDPQNRTLYEMGMTDGNYSYRAYKYDTNYVGAIASVTPHQQSPASSITCMPNPITDQAQIQCTIADYGIIHISLFDQLGREVSQIYAGDLAQGTHSFTINSGNLAAGVYHIKALGDNGFSLDKQIVILK